MTTLIEPRVLLAAKEFLLPGENTPGYAVVDSQFGVENWGSTPVPRAVRRSLRPINTLQLRGGQPDALIAPPTPEAYRGHATDGESSLPVAVVEAKGVTASGQGHDRNATRVAITQAHSHLGETNVGYAAVPRVLIRDEDRSLARELNIGLLSVEEGTVELIESPRLVGTDETPAVRTIRFHGAVGGAPVENFTKNHPKNALGYAIAVAHENHTDSVFKRYVIRSVGDACRDATALGLVTSGVNGTVLTPTGRETVRTIAYHHGSLDSALEAIDAQTRSRTRLIDALPVMGTVARQAILGYPPTHVLIDTLRALADEGTDQPSLSTVARAIARERPDFALDLFVSPVAHSRERILTGNDDQPLDLEAFESGAVYSTHTTFQYKAILYHCGLLTERGHDKKSTLDPTTDVWALETPLNR